VTLAAWLFAWLAAWLAAQLAVHLLVALKIALVVASLALVTCCEALFALLLSAGSGPLIALLCQACTQA
jgi:hypothetical protein